MTSPPPTGPWPQNQPAPPPPAAAAPPPPSAPAAPYAPPGAYLPTPPVGYVAYPAARPTNGLAIAGFVLSFLACLAVLGFIFSVVALSQIRRTFERGRGLAIAGICIACAWVAVFAVLVAFAIIQMPARDASGRLTGPAELSVRELRVGDCLEALPGSDSVGTVLAVPCDDPHRAEVFAIFAIAGSSYPGEAEVRQEAMPGCQSRLRGYSESAWRDRTTEIYAFTPTRQTWAEGDHAVFCILAHDVSTGSVRM